MTVPALREIWPPTIAPQLRGLLDAIFSGEEKTRHGQRVLNRALTPEEKTSALARGKELNRWLGQRDAKAMKAECAGMLAGFGGKDLSREEANVIVTQYVATAIKEGIPAWAFVRACQRFASGSVRPEEVGDKSLSYSFRPTTAHVCIVAAAIAEPLHRERILLGEALCGTPWREHEPTPEERARLAERFRALKAELTTVQAEDEVGRQARVARAMEEEVARRVEEYRKAGLEPPQAKVPPSLAMMLRQGYQIEEVGGRRVLTSPRHGTRFEDRA
jgi:hypothetical protein